MTPEPSMPKKNGSSGFLWYLPWDISQSGKFNEACDICGNSKVPKLIPDISSDKYWQSSPWAWRDTVRIYLLFAYFFLNQPF